MNKRQAAKNRKLRLENERLREAQRVRLATEYALQSTNERVDELHREICQIKKTNAVALSTQNQLVDQQLHLYRRYKDWQAEIRAIRASHMGINRRVAELENRSSLMGQLITASGIWLIIIIIVMVVMS